jgi:hypothetical protein
MNLGSELRAAADKVRQQHIDRMASLGVSGDALASLCYFDSHLAVAEVEEVSGLFVPCEGRPLHFLTPIRSGGELIDLCAWRPSRPDRWLLRTGAGWALGEDAGIGDWEYVLDLHATPLDWIKSGGSGLCVLDWSSPDLHQLALLHTIRVCDPELGKTLISALSRPIRLPAIEIQEARLAA